MFLVIGMTCSWGVLSVYVRQYFNLVGDKLEQRADEHGVPDLICDVLPRYKRRAADQDAHRFALKQSRELSRHLHITSTCGTLHKILRHPAVLRRAARLLLRAGLRALALPLLPVLPAAKRPHLGHMHDVLKLLGRSHTNHHGDDDKPPRFAHGRD